MSSVTGECDSLFESSVLTKLPGSEITLTQEEEGVFEAEQIKQDFDLPYSEGNTKELDWKFGAVSVGSH